MAGRARLAAIDGKGFTHVSELEYEDGEDDKVAALPPDLSCKVSEPVSLKENPILSLRDLTGGLTVRVLANKGCRYRISDTLKFILLPPRFENMVLY